MSKQQVVDYKIITGLPEDVERDVLEYTTKCGYILNGPLFQTYTSLDRVGIYSQSIVKFETT